MSTRVNAEHSEALGKLTLDISLIAGDGRLRMVGRQPGAGTALFDLIVAGGTMHVFVPPSDYFMGPIPDDGSPFAGRFGVEPGDLVPIALIGQRLARGSFYIVPSKNFTALIPDDADTVGDGLLRVDLDRELGVPRRAIWERGRTRWEVRYLGWDNFTFEDDLLQRSMMPTRFVIDAVQTHPERKRSLLARLNPLGWFRAAGPRITEARIEVRARENVNPYLLNPELDEQNFNLVFPQAVIQAGPMPLSELARALNGS